ncbi:hypothetical protein IAT38_000493 [Cryptococcus sp. DSM 104549]
MTYSLLVGGYRPSYSILSFDPSASSQNIKLLSDSAAPENASWIEPTRNKKLEDVLYSISEAGDGKAVSLKLGGEGAGRKVEVTAERGTGGGPCHVHIMKDDSGVVIANYVGGSIIYFPITPTGELSTTSSSPLLELPYVYKDQAAPDPERQDASHCHQVVEGHDGTLYVPDLGSDRVWVVWREGESGLSVKGWCQCPPGAGPRHCVVSEDGKRLYVLTELSNDILVFPLESPTYPIVPHQDFRVSVLPPSVPKEYARHLNAAELIAHPSHPNVLYASNRLELDLSSSTEGEFSSSEKGDAVAIVTLTPAGDKVVAIKHVRTGCNAVRGMRVSPDGKYVALAGQNGGGLEIYSVGDGGVEWDLVAKDETVEKVTDLVWV